MSISPFLRLEDSAGLIDLNRMPGAKRNLHAILPLAKRGCLHSVFSDEQILRRYGVVPTIFELHYHGAALKRPAGMKLTKRHVALHHARLGREAKAGLLITGIIV